jgi:hypothetical protein
VSTPPPFTARVRRLGFAQWGWIVRMVPPRGNFIAQGFTLTRRQAIRAAHATAASHGAVLVAIEDRELWP